MFLQDDSSGDDVQSHQENVEERQRDKPASRQEGGKKAEVFQ